MRFRPFKPEDPGTIPHTRISVGESTGVRKRSSSIKRDKVSWLSGVVLPIAKLTLLQSIRTSPRLCRSGRVKMATNSRRTSMNKYLFRNPSADETSLSWLSGEAVGEAIAGALTSGGLPSHTSIPPSYTGPFGSGSSGVATRIN